MSEPARKTEVAEKIQELRRRTRHTYRLKYDPDVEGADRVGRCKASQRKEDKCAGELLKMLRPTEEETG